MTKITELITIFGSRNVDQSKKMAAKSFESGVVGFIFPILRPVGA